MSAMFDWETDDSSDNEPVGGGVSDGGSNAVKEARQAYKAEKAARKQLEQELSAMKAQVRQITIRDTLASKGVTNPKIAAFVPADIDPTEEAVTSWLTENADVFGLQIESQPAEGVASEDASSLKQIQAFTQGSAAAAPTAEQTLSARIDAAKSVDELNALLREAAQS